MPFGLPFLTRASGSGRHARLAASSDQDDELDAAFAGPDDRRNSHDDTTQERTALVESRSSVSSENSPAHDDAPTDPLRRPYDPPPASQPHSDDVVPQPQSPAPRYEFLNPSARLPPPRPYEAPPAMPPSEPRRLSWRDRITSTLRYGRLATGDPDSNPHSHLSIHHPYGSGLGNDGVFANLSAKPEPVRRDANGGLEFVGGDEEGSNKETPPVSFACR